ncbi:MAG: hypothetical protein ACJAVY_001788 [Marinoscillum sp.]|jgi:hypothetical protein
MMKKLLLCLLIVLSAGAYAQNGIDDYSREFTWGVNKNTNSGLVGGVVLKFAHRQKEDVFATYGLEFFNVKHPQEFRYTDASSGSRFVWGKENFLFSIRTNYGRDILLYKKAPQQGVQISAVFSAGPTLGLIAPYYVLYNGKYVPYDASKYRNVNTIQGSGKVFRGIGESDVTFGLNAKAGLSFEFGAFKNNVAGVETGISLEAFPKEIILVPSQENSAVFTALYFTFYWGTRH